jgi:putative two-component system response regulator
MGDIQENKSNANRPKILCVDDAAFMLQTISTALGDEYEVFTLSKAKGVELFLQNNDPDLILLDYNMPDLTGFELVPIIKSIEAHKDTPIIFLTASGDTERVSEAISLGACDYVIKPLKAEILREKVAKHIAQRKASLKTDNESESG